MNTQPLQSNILILKVLCPYHWCWMSRGVAHVAHAFAAQLFPPANTDHDLTQLVAASAWCFWWAVNNANLMVSGNYGKNKHQKQKLWIIICNNSMTNKIEHLPIQSKQPFSVLRRLAKLAGVKQTLSKIGGRISKVGKQGLVNPAVTLMGSTTTDTRHSVD